jgi:hypothetical protein
LAVTARDRDVNRADLGWVGKELVEADTGSMAQRRTRPAGKDGAHLVCMRRRERANEEDAAMEASQLASPDHPL